MKYLLQQMRENDIKLWGVQEHHMNPQQLQKEVAKLKKKHYKVHAVPAHDMHNRDDPESQGNTGALLLIARRDVEIIEHSAQKSMILRMP